MNLAQLLQLLMQQGGAGGAGGGGGIASIGGSSPLGLLSGGGGVIKNLAGLFSGQGGTQGTIESGINAALDAGALIPGPQEPFVAIAAAVAPFLESLFGGGVPRQAKTEAVGQAASASGDPIDQLLGQYINQAVGAGHVLSESSSSNFELGTERMAAILEALTGHQSPNVQGTGFQNNPNLNLPQLGQLPFKLPTGYNFLSTDPTTLSRAEQDIQNLQGFGATDIFGPSAQQEWQKVVQELINQGLLTKYSGPLGAVGGSFAGPGGTGVPGTAGTSGAIPGVMNTSAIPNVQLPHPLAPDPNQTVQQPYQPFSTAY